MAILGAASSLTSLPTPVSGGRDARVRQASVDIQEQNTERERSRAGAAQIIQTSDEQERVTRVERNNEPTFRAIPSFDDLPAGRQQALQSYLTTAQTGPVESGSGAELIVGIDTFA